MEEVVRYLTQGGSSPRNHSQIVKFCGKAVFVVGLSLWISMGGSKTKDAVLKGLLIYWGESRKERKEKLSLSFRSTIGSTQAVNFTNDSVLLRCAKKCRDVAILTQNAHTWEIKISYSILYIKLSNKMWFKYIM